MSRNGLGDQIAVLDGFDLSSAGVAAASGPQALSIAAGGTYSGGSSWEPGIPTIYGRSGLAAGMDINDYITDPEKEFMDYINDDPRLSARKNVIDASGGANYSGGSSFAPGLPLLPSNSGLAGDMALSAAALDEMADISLRVKQVMPGVQARAGVVDASAGANYSGGSSYAPGLPLMPSTTGLAGCLSCGGAPDSAMADLEAMDLRVRQTLPGVQNRSGVVDASAGGNYSGGSSYAPGLPLMPSSAGLAAALDAVANMSLAVRQVMPGVQTRSGVVDASAGANYSGGSSYAPGLPLMPSTTGLAGLDALDDVDDAAFGKRLTGQARALFSKVAGKKVVGAVKRNGIRAARGGNAAGASAADRQLRIARLCRRLVAAQQPGAKMSANVFQRKVQQAAAAVARNIRPG